MIEITIDVIKDIFNFCEKKQVNSIVIYFAPPRELLLSGSNAGFLKA